MDLFKYFKKEIKLPITQTEQVSLQRFNMPNQKSETSYLKEYKNWVFTCINARAEDVASIELELKDKKTEKEIELHPVLDLLNDVNPYMTKYELFYNTQGFLDLTGNAFWYLARDKNGAGKPKQIYLLSPDKVSIILSKENPMTIEGYVFQQGKSKIPFNPNEIIHFRNFNPMTPYPFTGKGVGVVEMALWAIETDNESRNWNYSFFKNNAKPDGILKTEGKLTDEQFRRLKESWEQTYQGSSKNGKVAIFEGGLSWQEMSKTQKDMDFVAQRTFSRDEILSIFRVPKTVVGITDDVNRANAEASDYVFAKRTIKPLMKRFVTILNEYLLPEYGDNLEFDFEDPVPEDRMAELQEYSLGHNKWLTTNDIRREEGLVPSVNGDVFYGQFSEVAIDNVPQTKTIKDTTPVSKTVDKVVDNFIAKLPQKKEKELKKLTNTQKAIYKDAYIKRFDANEKALKKDVIAYFKTQEDEVLKNLEEEYKGLTPKEYKFKGINDVLFNNEKAIATGISMITPHIRKFLSEGAEMADSTTGGNFNESSPSVLNFIKERAKFFAETINDTTRESLLTTIKEGVENLEGFNDIKKRVESVYIDAETYRTDRITRTEVSASINEGVKESLVQAGIEYWEYVAVVDSETSEECLMNDGEVRKIGEDFPSGIKQAPDNHPNCRCTMVSVFNE